jgi:hypothetical protein
MHSIKCSSCGTKEGHLTSLEISVLYNDGGSSRRDLKMAFCNSCYSSFLGINNKNKFCFFKNIFEHSLEILNNLKGETNANI